MRICILRLICDFTSFGSQTLWRTQIFNRFCGYSYLLTVSPIFSRPRGINYFWINLDHMRMCLRNSKCIQCTSELHPGIMLTELHSPGIIIHARILIKIFYELFYNWITTELYEFEIHLFIIPKSLENSDVTSRCCFVATKYENLTKTKNFEA